MKGLSSRALVLSLVLCAALLAAGLGVMRNRSADAKAASVAKIPVLEFVPEDLYTVQVKPIERTLPITGTLMALNSATLRAKVAGELIEVTAREGQAVRKGDLLARIDQTEVQARVAAKSADVAAAKAQLQLAEKNRITQKALLDRNFISQNAFDTTQSSFDVAVARLRSAEADLVSAKKTLGDSALYAPFSGVVSERLAQPGERVALDAKILSIVDLTVLTLEAPVPASTVAQVRVGQPVSFRVEGFGDRSFSGRIDRINPAAAAGSRSITLYAVLENNQNLLRGGLFAQGELTLEKIPDALVIPASSVREEIGQTFVYALDNGMLRKKPVKIGRSDPKGTLQVVAGLREGDKIVRSNLGQLRDETPVQVRATPASQPAASLPK